MELKAYKMVDEMYCTDCVCVIPSDVYFKSEADEVIAELKDKLQAANEQIENLINSASNIMLFQDRINDNKCAELRHQKYRRCLAMAMWCRECSWSKCVEKVDFYYKWYNRWLELAEKLKDKEV